MGKRGPRTPGSQPNSITASIEFQTGDGYTGAVGTPQQLLDRLPSLLAANAAATKDFAGHPVPVLGLPGGAYVSFGSTANLQNYLTRSAQPVVPTVTVRATFQDVLGRAATEQTVGDTEVGASIIPPDSPPPVAGKTPFQESGSVFRQVTLANHTS